MSLGREDKALSVLLLWRGGAQVGTWYLVVVKNMCDKFDVFDLYICDMCDDMYDVYRY